jgi:FkbM family methyltransferase
MPTHNGEDQTIRRLLGGLATKPGFYLDIGANDPLTTSNTHGFYLEGWHGIDIEPTPALARQLRLAHPRNMVVEAAAGAMPGRAWFWLQGINGELSTLADRHAKPESKVINVDVVRVGDLLKATEADHHGQIAFVSLDVEGFEQQVLEGFDLDRWHPSLFCVEATEPNSLVPAYAGWEPLLLNASYRCVFTDPYNRYYMRA